MELDRLEKRKDYTAKSKITRKDAWEDLKHDMGRLGYALYLFWHIVVGQCVNLVRLCGILDREKSQFWGRTLFTVLIALILLVPLYFVL